MRIRLMFFALIILLASSGCKASEQSAARDDSESQTAQSESTEQVEPKEDEQVEPKEEEKEEQGGEQPEAPTREQLDQLSKAGLRSLKESNVHQQWATAGDVGNTAVIGWDGFGFEGPDALAGSASALRSYFETKSVNDLPVDVASITSLAEKQGADLSQFDGATHAERLGKIGARLGLDFVGTGILIRDTSEGAATFKLRVLVVQKGANKATFDETVVADQ